MKRVVISIALLVTFLTSMCFATWETSWGTVMGDLSNLNDGTVEASIVAEVKESSGSTYASSITLAGVTPNLDLRAKLDMSAVQTKFDTIIAEARRYAATQSNSDELLADLPSVPLSGRFVITVSYPSAIVSETSMNALAAGTSLAGFTMDGGVGTVYSETVARRIEDSTKTGWKNLIFTIDTVSGLTVGDFETNGFKDITFEATHIVLSGEYQTFNIDINLDGDSWIGTDEQMGEMQYAADGTVKITMGAPASPSRPRPSGGSGSGSGSEPKPGVDEPSKEPSGEKNVVIQIPGQEDLVIETKEGETPTVGDIKVPEIEGFAFAGFYLDDNYKEAAADDMTVDGGTTLYARLINLTAPEDLNADEHIAYIKGYPDGDVRPYAPITREEIATIFYRILKDSKRNTIYAETNNFKDVEGGRWSNIAISTMANGGYLNGYPDGTFRPSANITRAEFATIIARFTKAIASDNLPYNDIDGHWAENYIVTAEASRWLDGHAEDSFRPDEYITRADVISIVNSVLVRYVHEDGLKDGYIMFPDNEKTSEYYYEIIEATNGHDQERAEDKYNELWQDVEKTDIEI